MDESADGVQEREEDGRWTDRSGAGIRAAHGGRAGGQTRTSALPEAKPTCIGRAGWKGGSRGLLTGDFHRRKGGEHGDE